MNRTQWTLAGVLLVQVLVLLLIAAPWSSHGGSSGPRTLLPEMEAITPSRIEISEGDETLVLNREADRWTVEQAGGYPADEAKVDRLLGELRQLEVRRPVVTGSRYHDALKVGADQYERRLEVWDAEQGDPKFTLFLGSSPNYGVNHVRRGDENSVYEVRGLSPWDLRAQSESWIDTQLIDVPAEEVTSLKLSNGHGEFALTRQDGSWVLEGGGDAAPALDPAKVDSLVRSIGSLRFSEPAGRTDEGQAYGFGAPAATVELVRDVEGQQPETVELIVGKQADKEAGTRYAHRSGSEYGVILGKVAADRVLDAKLEDLLVDSGNTDAG